MRIRNAAVFAAILAGVLAGCHKNPPPSNSMHKAAVPVTWSAAWGTAQAQAIQVGPWQNQTLRMAARVSASGSEVRIHLGNYFATSTATFGHVSIGLQQNGPWTTDTPVTATFSGLKSVTLSPGSSVVSDPVSFPVSANSRVLVSVYLPAGANITSAPVHQLPSNTEYNISGSDAAGISHPSVTNTFGFTSYLTGIDVDSPQSSAVVAVGDSITDGQGSPPDSDDRWPDYLADQTALLGYGVVDAGIVGDWVTRDQPGNQSVSNRWTRDVLSVTGVRTVIDAAGINDLRGGVSAAALEFAQNNLVQQAHAAGVKVILTTLTPCSGDSLCTSSFIAQWEAYNAWVFSGSSLADGVADFNGAVMGTTNPLILNPMYDSGDHIHPNAAGYEAMAACVNEGEL